MNNETRPYDFDRVFRLVLSVAGFLAVFWLVWYLRDVLLPLTVALVLAYLLNPIVTRIEARTGQRWLAVGLTLLGFGVIFLGAAGLVIPRLFLEISDLSANLQAMHEKDPTWGGLLAKLPDDLEAAVAESIEALVRELDSAAVMAAAKQMLPRLWGIVTGGLSLILSLMTVVVIFLYLVFFLLDFQALESTWSTLLPPTYRDSIVEFAGEFRDAMSKYFRGQFVVALCVGVLFAFGFSLIGIRLSILLGLTVGMLNMVPYLQTAGLVPALALGALRAVEDADRGLLAMVLAVLAVFAIVQLIQDALLTPWIIGEKTGLRPAWILLSITVWGKLLGFLGLVAAIPLTCLVFAYYRRYLERMKATPSAGAPPSPRVGN